MWLSESVVGSVILFFIFSCNVFTQEHGFGLLLDDNLYINAPVSPVLLRGDYDNLPQEASLKPYTPKPGNQGSFSTCTSWATAYTARTILEARTLHLKKTQIDTCTFSPSFVYNQIRPRDGCNSGTSLIDALDVLKDKGNLRFSDFGYDCDRHVNDTDFIKANKYKILEYREIADRKTVNKTQFIKKSIVEGKPVVIGFDCPKSFDNAGEFWKPDSNEYKEWSRGHAITIIGYNDNKFGGAFELMNSWGQNWGKGGFTWIRYSDMEYFCKLAFEIIDKRLSDSSFADLSGSLLFRESSGTEMKARFNGKYYVMEKPYPTGTLFDLHISNNEPAYVYAFSSDLSFKTYKIFPFKNNMSAYLPYSKNNIAIPDEDSYNLLDSTKGKTYFCFLYSKSQLEIQDIMMKIENGDGSLWDRLSAALTNKKVAEANITYGKEGSINFKANSGDKYVVPVLIEIEHY